MAQDLHVRIAASLHIATALFLLLALAAIGPLIAAFGALSPSWGVDPDLAATVGGLGMILVGLGAVLGITEFVGAVLLLRGRPSGRSIIVGCSVLGLLNIPIGTLAGLYSLWALLREVPAPTPAPMGTPAGPVRA